ncbi:FCD domain-containing protein [Aestuariivirga sp.]|jgi:DNA-binding FadR family transcriptional regulator|uniref:FCD domain-containing protein n=1 Tax=Aestuariivirga sp. TaxID=2650926 RepID=UPI003784DBD3
MTGKTAVESQRAVRPAQQQTRDGSQMLFTSIKRRKVHQDVAEQIENQILSGLLPEGASLPSERNLMEAFDVGRPAIREALLLLQRSGFIRITNGGRTVVTRPTAANLLEQLSGSARYLLSSEGGEKAFQDARRIFESAIARNAAELATDKDIARLGEYLKINREALGDMDAFERSDIAFHLALAEIGGNPVFSALHAAISEWLALQRHISLRVPGVALCAYRSHEEIHEAVAARNPEAAWHAMDRHLKTVAQQFEQGKGRPA